MYRKSPETEVLLVHPGGPFFAKKDLGSWSIPKGEYATGEDPLTAAQREFLEETGTEVKGAFQVLTAIRQKGGKEVKAWAIEGDIDPAQIISNTFEIEWPPRSGKKQVFPEVDKAGWFILDEARKKINEKQAAFLDELELLLQSRS